MKKEIILALLLLDDDEDVNESAVERSCWVRPWLSNRDVYGAYHRIFQEVRHDAQSCRKFIRMDNYQSLYLVDRLSGDLQ